MNIQTQVALPKLAPVSILDQYGIGRVTRYDFVNKMPDELKVYFGKRLFLKVEPLIAWIEAGGSRQAS